MYCRKRSFMTPQGQQFGVCLSVPVVRVALLGGNSFRVLARVGVSVREEKVFRLLSSVIRGSEPDSLGANSE